MRFIISDEFKVKRPSSVKKTEKQNQEDNTDQPIRIKNAGLMAAYCMERGYPKSAYGRAVSYLKKKS